MFGLSLKTCAGSKERNESGGGLAPVIDSVDGNLSQCNNDPPGSPIGFKDVMTLSGGAIVEADTEYLYTHWGGGTGASPNAFPGPSWTAYTQDPGDDATDWDPFGNENGPLNQPTAAGPYIGADPWNNGKSDSVISGNGGGRWRRIEVTVKNASGQDTAAVFFQDDCF